MSDKESRVSEENLECDEVLCESPIPEPGPSKKRDGGKHNGNKHTLSPERGDVSVVVSKKKRKNVDSAIQSRKVSPTMVRGRHFMVVVPQRMQERVLNILSEKCAYYIGQQEKGPGGSVHYQLVFGFPYQKTVSAVTKLLNVRSVEIVRDLRKSIMYVTKVETRIGDIIEFGDVPSTEHAGHNRLVQDASLKDSYEEAMKYLEENDLMFFLTHKKTIGPWLSAKFKEDVDVPLYDIQEFNKSKFTNFSKTLVLIGPTGVGKTQFALAHFKNPLLIRDKNDYIRYNRHTDGIIFDDLSFNSWNPMTFLHMVENETPITQDVKFGHVRIRARIPKFILVNSEELLWPRDIIKETKDACLRRMTIVHVRNRLFNLSEVRVFSTMLSLFFYICYI